MTEVCLVALNSHFNRLAEEIVICRSSRDPVCSANHLVAFFPAEITTPGHCNEYILGALENGLLVKDSHYSSVKCYGECSAVNAF